MKQRGHNRAERQAAVPLPGHRPPHSRLALVALPLLVSVVIHATLALLIWTAPGVTAGRGQEPAEPAPMVEGQTRLYDAAPGGVPYVGLNHSPSLPASEWLVHSPAYASAVAEQPSPRTDPGGIVGGPGSGDPLPPLVNLGLAQVWNTLNTGTGQGGPADAGDGDAGPLAAFGVPAGGSIEFQPPPSPPEPRFSICLCGGANVRKIVFVCDVSASMLNRSAMLKAELRRAVEGLKPVQSFNVIFFQGGPCLALDLNGVVLASADNKRRAYALIDGVATGGVTDPLPALDLAFRQHPSLIYLLTDGGFADAGAVSERIRQLNPERKVKVNVVAFVASREGAGGALSLCERVAKEGGGTFRVLCEQEQGQDR